MGLKIVSKPKFTVVGIKYHGKNEHNEIPQLWQHFGPRMGEVQHPANSATAYGLMGNYDPATGEFDYLAGMEAENTADLPTGMTRWDVPAQSYLVFATPFAKIREAYTNIYQRDLPQSGHQHSGGTEFELYDEQFNLSDPNSILYIYIPVK